MRHSRPLSSFIVNEIGIKEDRWMGFKLQICGIRSNFSTTASLPFDVKIVLQKINKSLPGEYDLMTWPASCSQKTWT